MRITAIIIAAASVVGLTGLSIAPAVAATMRVEVQKPEVQKPEVQKPEVQKPERPGHA